MNNKNLKILLEESQNEFNYQKSKSNLNITFNRISFIFFIFFIIFTVYTIHLIHLGSRNQNIKIDDKQKFFSNNLYRADILDRNGNYLSKTVSSIDIGISTAKVIDKKKLLINLKYIFPNKDYSEIKKRIKKGKFFYFEKKFLIKITKN